MRFASRLALLASMVAVAPLASAGAQESHSLACRFESTVRLEPGETFTPAQGTYAGSGVVVCVGSYAGESVDAAGAIAYEGVGGASGPIAEHVGGDTCAAGSGTGSVEITFETASGTPVELRYDYALVRLGPVGVATAEGLVAAFQFLPDTDFDCIYNPIEEAAVYGQALLRVA